MGQADAFASGLTDAVKQEGRAMVEAAKSFVMSSEEIVKGSPFADKLSGEQTNL